MNGSVIHQVNEQIGRIRFFHPQSNSLPGSLLRKLAQTITQLGKETDVRVIVLESEGSSVFCAGASFDELVAIQTEEEGLRFFSGFAEVINAMRNCPKFIIGRIQGKTVGGGVGLAASVDYALATQYASVKLSELAIGIGPFVVGPAVERKMGLSAMSQLAINASEWQSAIWAKEKGLYQEVFETTDELDVGVNALAERLKNYSPDAMKELKMVFWEGTEHWDKLLSDRAKVSGTLVLSDFTRNAIAAFKAK